MTMTMSDDAILGTAYPAPLSLVVGTIGPSGCGKDAFMVALAEVAAVPVVKSAFADALREEIELELTGQPGVQLSGLRDKPLGEGARMVLQQWGTELRRHKFPNWWVDRNDERIRRIMSEHQRVIVVITDARFPNECDLVHEYAGLVTWVDRPMGLCVEACPEIDRNHASETALLPWHHHADVTIDNSGDLAALSASAVGFLESYAPWALGT
jgi:hypothetical protein